jgi:hypothetical protein
MKTPKPAGINKLLLAMPLLLITMIVFVLSISTTEANEVISCAPEGKTTDSIIVKKMFVTKKCTIRIYPNATHEVLFFSVNGNEGKVYDLFIFDMDGKLVKRTQVRNRETTLLKTFQKGSYFFEVFSNDERIENGNMIIN